jgi:molybdate transport system regulatory protein
MNKLPGKITQVQRSGALVLVDIDVAGMNCSSLIVNNENEHSWIEPGSEVFMIFKEMEVSLARNFSGQISLRNRFECFVLSVEYGEIVAQIRLQFDKYVINSVITARSARMFDLKKGDAVTALIKANEMSLQKQ